MATFILMGNYSQDAVEEISAQRTDDTRKIIAENSGEMRSVYVTLGDVDLHIVADFPDMKEALKTSIELTKSTGISFTTNQCLSAEDFDKLMS